MWWVLSLLASTILILPNAIIIYKVSPSLILPLSSAMYNVHTIIKVYLFSPAFSALLFPPGIFLPRPPWPSQYQPGSHLRRLSYLRTPPRRLLLLYHDGWAKRFHLLKIYGDKTHHCSVPPSCHLELILSLLLHCPCWQRTCGKGTHPSSCVNWIVSLSFLQKKILFFFLLFFLNYSLT